MDGIVPALASLKIGMEMALLAIEARDDGKVREAIAEMSKRLADANLAALAMSEKLLAQRDALDDATSKLRAAEQRLRQREKYALRAVAQGVFAYAYEPVGNDATPAHYQCQICFDAGKDSILSRSLNGTHLYCRIDRAHSLQLSSVQVDVIPHRGGGGSWMGS